MKRVGFLLLALLFVVLVPGSVCAEVSVNLRLDRAEAVLADSVRMVVSVSGTRDSALVPTLKGLEHFTVTPGGTSSRLEIRNGQVNSGVDYTYFLQAKKTGSFQIGPAEVRIEGKIYRSNSEALTIVKPGRLPGVDGSPLFLSSDISPKKVYVEEQAIYTVKLYRRARVSDISLNLPDTDYLTFKKLGKPVEYRSVHDGQTYQVLEVRYALLPTREGDHTIAPARMNLTVYQPQSRSPRSPFDDTFFRDPFFSVATGRPMTLASEPLELQALPLPEKGRPTDFSGLVGSFAIESKLEPRNIKVGESATLTVFLSGRGNVNRIPDLKIPELEHIKVYGDQPALEIGPDGKGLAGSKTMKWALVPDKEGDYQIPRLEVSFFDTRAHTYRVITTSPHAITVLPGEAERIQASRDAMGASARAKHSVEELGRDILPIHISVKNLKNSHSSWLEGLSFPLFLMAPVLIYAATFFGTRLRKKSVQESSATKARKATKALLKQYRHDGLNWSQLAPIIRDYVNDRFGLTLGFVTAEEAAEILKSNGVSLGTAEKLKSILQRLEDAVFTGRGNESCDLGEEIPQLIKQIEKEVR
jgi:hypothetical protein